MTSQALTISARHTSSTVPRRLQQRHSLRDKEWRAMGWACVAKVQHPFHLDHSTRRSITPAVGEIPTLYPSTPGRAHHGAQQWDSGYQCEQRLPGGRLGPLRPSRMRDLGLALARPLHSLTAIPKPLVTRRAGRRHQRRRCEGALLARPTNGRPKNLRLSAQPLRRKRDSRTWARASRAQKKLANVGARIARLSRNLRNVRARACTRTKTCDYWRKPIAPKKELADIGAHIMRPRKNLRDVSASACTRRNPCNYRRNPSAP